MNEAFTKPYDPKAVEDKIYRQWEQSGYFAPEAHPPRADNPNAGKPFTIIMPPPNANGSLHLGHALMITLEDIMIRYKRMCGYKTLWLPGADHAGFETQVVYQKKLEKEGKNWFQIPREQLWQEIWDFTQSNKQLMENQIKSLGASCDWSRKKFTLDEDIISKTQDAFIQMYNEGLIYRGNRLVNWCPKHQTGFSDLEIKYEEKTDPLYYIKYGPITLATVRLETIFGDTAVAVNPKDKRYKNLIGKEIEADIVIDKIKIPVIADDAVDMKFGTGVVKITPAHDPADYEMWQRHKEEIDGPIEVVDKFGKLNLLGRFPKNEKAKEFQGLKAHDARKLLAHEMEVRGLIEKIDHNYKHNVGTCYKCGNVLEPRLMPQWFIKMEPLAKPAIETAQKGKLFFIPARFKKVYLHWLKNIRDWNISRQIVWGIRIPAWQCQDCKEWIISKEKPLKCVKCSNTRVEQDADVFDTWFSSGQWPFLTLGYQNSPKSKISDFDEFYPTDVMETGWDILFFWVARMVMLGIYKTKKIPFKYIYLHGLVRDKDKQKMSKSKGNVVDPLGIVNEYGADALRMALIVGNTPGNDPVFSEEKVRGYRNFANKIWQASRFVLMNLEGFNVGKKPILSVSDKKRLKEFEVFKNKIRKQMDNFKFYQAAEDLYHYFWHTFADKVIEESKESLKGEDKGKKQSSQYMLLEILNGSLKLLHPFMPFITEEIYQKLPSKKAEFLMVDKW